jgi:hypothetical protein
VTSIRAIFDGKTFVPQGPVSLPPQAEALVLVETVDPAAEARVDDAIRAYYQSGPDADDEAWTRATEKDSYRAWDED